MVLTKSELIASLQNEVRILLHLAGKIDRAKLDYRPTPKQRSTLELLQYLTMMGPGSSRPRRPARSTRPPGRRPSRPPPRETSIRRSRRSPRRPTSTRRCSATCPTPTCGPRSNSFGDKTTRGAFIVNWVLCGCAAYRTQLFLYLKACGREELGTMNLWAGIDAPAPV